MINCNAKNLETLVITQNRHKTNGMFKKKTNIFHVTKFQTLKARLFKKWQQIYTFINNKQINKYQDISYIIHIYKIYLYILSFL